MKRLIHDLVAELRMGGLPVSVAESIDAAASAAAAGFERGVLREALAAALVKDESDRSIFLDAFERVFPAQPPAPARRGRRRRGASGAGEAAGGGGAGSAGATAASAGGRTGGAGTPAFEDARAAGAGERGALPRRQDAGRERERRRAGESSERETRAGADSGAGRERDQARALARGEGRQRALDRRERELLAAPFGVMSPRDVEEASALVRVLARRFALRLRRRTRPRKRGRLDFRRTIRASVSHGGVLLERRYRARRPRKLSLVALCDMSASVAMATDFFLALLAPAERHFASVRLFGFVDRLVEIEFVEGRVRPAAMIDLMARSDFGRVLVDLMAGVGCDLTGDTVLLVLGDARNNRRPPRADLLAAARARVRRLLWLNPDPPRRWNTGDSVIASYARHADLVLACGSLGELDRALTTITRP